MARLSALALSIALGCASAVNAVAAWDSTPALTRLMMDLAVAQAGNSKYPENGVVSGRIIRSPSGEYLLELKVMARQDLERSTFTMLNLGGWAAISAPYSFGPLKKGQTATKILPLKGYTKKRSRETMQYTVNLVSTEMYESVTAADPVDVS